MYRPALLLMMQLHPNAWCTHILPALSSNSFLSVGTFANNGYITIVHASNDGTTVHDHNDITSTKTKPAILHGCHDDKGFRSVLLLNPSCHTCHHILYYIHNIYDLPSTKHIVRYCHAAIRFPTKATLLSAKQWHPFHVCWSYGCHCCQTLS
ncbi:hypothetical protein ACHAW6_006586 [Cyclotella cf. meneghiniana]